MVAFGLADRGVVAFWGWTRLILDDVKAYYVKVWGEPSRTATFRFSGHLVEVWKWSAESNPEQVNIYATIGASAHVMAGYDNDHRTEFFVGLQPAQDEIARPLSMLALEAMSSKVELGHGHSLTFPEPLWKGTEMAGFLVIRPRTQIIPGLALASGLHVDFLQAIPAYESEVSFKAQHTVEGLLDLWQEASVAFWDPNRAAPPGMAEVSN